MSVSLKEVVANEYYDVKWLNNNFINVSSAANNAIDYSGAGAEPPTPFLSKADFSFDGGHVYVYFDSPTNCGGMKIQSYFSCSEIFYFQVEEVASSSSSDQNMAVHAVCSWLDNTRVQVSYPITSSHSHDDNQNIHVSVSDAMKLNIGSKISLVENAAKAVKASCDGYVNQDICQQWKGSPANTITHSTAQNSNSDNKNNKNYENMVSLTVSDYGMMMKPLLALKVNPIISPCSPLHVSMLGSHAWVPMRG